MTIRASHAKEIRELIESLGADADVDRDVAVARLAVIGVRAVDRLVAAYEKSGDKARVGILRALEAIGDPRTITIARSALQEGGELAVAAAGSLRALLDSTNERVATEALDALVGTALDRSAERRVRMAAYEALGDMPEAVRAPVADALQRDGRIEQVRQKFSLAEATWQDAVDGRLPENPAALREALDANGESAPLGALQKLVDAVRAREGATASETERDAWRQIRGAFHQALALRGSRVALYDLRETFEGSGEQLPATFLAALQVVGDESCLEPVAAAWTAAAADDAGLAWRHQLESAFAAIVKRDKPSRKSAILKRIETKFPDAARAFSTPSRTTPRRSTRRRI